MLDTIGKRNECPGNSTLNFTQGSYGSWKTWKVMQFYFLAFQPWKVMEFCVELWKGHGKLNHYKKIMSRSLLCIMIDKNFTECILLNYE